MKNNSPYLLDVLTDRQLASDGHSRDFHTAGISTPVPRSIPHNNKVVASARICPCTAAAAAGGDDFIGLFIAV